MSSAKMPKICIRSSKRRCTDEFQQYLFLFSALPLFYALYLLTPPKGKRYMLLVISFAAYFWVEPLFSILLLMLACYLYLLNLRMQQVRQYKKLAICMELIGIVLFLLLYFKYYGFLLSGISALTSFDFTCGCSLHRRESASSVFRLFPMRSIFIKASCKSSQSSAISCFMSFISLRSSWDRSCAIRILRHS